MILHGDAEVFSRTNLKKVGVYRYVEDPSTEILCFAFAFDHGPIHLWIPFDQFEFPEKLYVDTRNAMQKEGQVYLQRAVPKTLRAHIESGAEFRAHNANYERTVLNGLPGQNLEFPKVSIEQTVCTAVKCAEYGLPRDLERAAIAADTHRKDQNGKQDMMAVTKPRKGKEPRYTPENSPERFLKLYCYCMDDVRAERALDDFVPDITPREQRLYCLDQRMNDRGIRVDLPRIHDALFLIKEYKALLEKRCIKVTGFKPTQREKVFNWCQRNQFRMPDMLAQTVIKAVKDDRCPEDVREILKLYSTYGMKAVSKYSAMLASVCSDDRLRGMFMFYGAAPGRWSSRIVQLHNLMRPVIKDISTAIAAFEARDISWIRTLYDIDPMRVFGSCIRGMLIPAEGHDYLAIDFASIEARIVAWLADAEDILKVFRGHGKIYEHTAAKIYNKPMELITPEERFIGKIACLSIGYQGASAAFMKMAKQFSVEIDAVLAETIVYDWRGANPRIVKLWEYLNTAACLAVKNPGKIYAIPNKKIRFQVISHWLSMRLPSGRQIKYYKPEVETDLTQKPKYQNQLYYWGIDTYTRKYCHCDTYGGQLLQNCLTGETQVLTHRGWIRLYNYKPGDLLWDGDTWVYGGKLISQGIQSVIKYAGIELTAEHKVLTDEGWKEAIVASSKRLNWKTVLLPESNAIFAQPQRSNVLETPMWLRQTVSGTRKRINSRSRTFTKILWLQNRRTDRFETDYSWNEHASVLSRMGQYARSVSASVASSLAQLRRTGNSCLQAMAQFQQFQSRYVSILSFGFNFGSRKQRPSLHTEKLPMGFTSSELKQYTIQCENRHALGIADAFRSSSQNKTSSINNILANKKWLAETRLAEVFDILNAGLQHRFTVRGKQGQILIVHNCCEGIARDLLTPGLERLEAAGYEPIGSVHDEGMAEPKADHGSFEEAKALMIQPLKWAEGLPVAAEGFRESRYRK